MAGDKEILLLFLGLYLILLAFIGYYWMRRIGTVEDFLMGGRRLGPFILLATTLATMVGTGSTMGASGLGYRGGWAGSLYGFGGAVGLFLIGIMFSDLRRYRFMTMAEELACYYGGNRVIYHTAAVLLFLASVGWLGLHLMGGGFYLSFITGIPAKTAIMVGGLGFAVYVILGGYFAVVYTDLIQVIILFFGFILLSIFTLVQIGGLSGLAAGVPADFMSFLGYKAVGWQYAVSTAMASGVGVMVTPSFRHRIYSGKDVKTVRNSYLWTALATTVFCLFPSIIGMGAYVLDSSIPNSDHALPWLAVSVFPIGVAALVIISGLSATLSSADSDSACGVVFFIRHLYSLFAGRYPSDPIKTSRVTIGVMFFIAVLSVIWFETLIGYINVMTSLIFSGLLAVVILGKYWKGATPQGAMGAIAAGILTSAVILGVPSLKAFFVEPILPATVMSFAAGWVVSLVSGGGEKVPFEVVAKIMEEERRELESRQASGNIAGGATLH